MASPFLQGFQVGAGVASDRANRALRMQQLQSERQMRMLQERNLAEQLALRMEERNLAIQERADMTKAITAAQEATQPFHIVQGEDGEMGVPNPNPMTQEQAAMTFVLPVIGKYQPDKVPQFLQGVALGEARRNANQSLVAQRESQINVNEARAREIEERITQLQKGKTGVDPEWVRSINFLEQRRGSPFSPEELDEMWAIHSGQKARAGAQRPAQTEMEYINQQLPSARRAERQELKSTYRTDQQLIEDLRAQYRDLIKSQQPQVQPEMQPSTIQPEAPQFQKGQRVKQNGVTFEFDGSKWNAIK